MLKQEWEIYWDKLLNTNKLHDTIKQLDLIDGNTPKTKNLCHEIWGKYDSMYKKLNSVREDLIRTVETFPKVHLHTSRVKSLDSILCKIITKRHERIMNPRDLYSHIDSENFQNILTDLIGIRIIVSYSGDWKDLHKHIMKEFPLKPANEYETGKFISHQAGEKFIAEKPKAYYSYGDNTSLFADENLDLILKENGYRGIHYILSFEETYIELQVRTIYDEAWSDCDHRYVYKQEHNVSHSALSKLSFILSSYTNASNDLGEELKKIYEDEPIVYRGNNEYNATPDTIHRISVLYDRFSKINESFLEFKNNLKEDEHHEQ